MRIENSCRAVSQNFPGNEWAGFPWKPPQMTLRKDRTLQGAINRIADVRAAEKALEAIMIDFKKRSSVNVRLREKMTGPVELLNRYRKP